MLMTLVCGVVLEDTKVIVSLKTNNVAGVAHLNVEQWCCGGEESQRTGHPPVGDLCYSLWLEGKCDAYQQE